MENYYPNLSEGYQGCTSLSREVESYIDSEFLDSQAAAYGIVHSINALQREARMHGLHEVGDFYHRVAYTRLASFTSRITESFDFAVSDLGLIPALFQEELLAAGLVYLSYTIGRIIGQEAPIADKVILISKNSLALATGAAMAVILASATYGLNFLRTPLEEKLNLSADQFEVAEEIEFVIERLNVLVDVERVELEDLVLKVFEAVEKFTAQVDGYTFSSARKVKRSFVGNSLFHRRGIVAFMNPFIHEVVFATDLYPETMAHEFAHLRGLPKELQAQLVGVIAQIQSGCPYVQYLGYREWLNILVGYHKCLQKDEILQESERSLLSIEFLRVAGLNARTLGELQERNRIVQEQVARLSCTRFMQNAERFLLGLIPGRFRELLLTKSGLILAAIQKSKFSFLLLDYKSALNMGFKNLLLRITGEKDIKEAYLRAPIAYLRSYRSHSL
ncbi:DUF3810 family protein [Candidatus Dojkabacteria bacterium]|nr:DUF3810 family protein [Candidatus Dojkabacteria bacterium]